MYMYGYSVYRTGQREKHNIMKSSEISRSI